MQSEELTGKLAGTTRRSFIRGIARPARPPTRSIARASDRCSAAPRTRADRSRFADFNAIAASPADRFEVAEGFRADVLIAWGDTFRDTQGNEFEFGFNNDFLAYFPLKGSEEGILFINHEYPGPFYQHGFKPDAAGLAEGKTLGGGRDRAPLGRQLDPARASADRDGIWRVVSPSKYNRASTAATSTRPRRSGRASRSPARSRATRASAARSRARSATAPAASRRGARRSRARRTSTATGSR